MVEVHEKPLIWYVFLTLYKHGFREFIFPLGYKGEIIREFVSSEFSGFDCQLHFFSTGEDTPIAKRLHLVSHEIPDGSDFFLVNGDTFFDFEIEKMYQLHDKENALLTLSSVEIVSSYGLIIEKQGKIEGFARDKRVSHLNVENGGQEAKGYVNAGLTLISKSALAMIDLKNSENFEHDLFPEIIKANRAAHYKIDGEWFPVDTQKDLSIINLDVMSSLNIGDKVKTAKKNLADRYMYRTHYFEDVQALKTSILNKTVIPHQVEIQPGAAEGADLCWLKCPYCYGLSADDDNSRLSPERYIEIMRQIAEGGVKKVVFAGYATDPLNYRGITDLHEIALDSGMIFGFHTKALKVSERLLEQLTHSKVVPLSYFSISVDAGNDESYNKVHGVDESKARIYSKVLANIRRISDAREKTGAPLDLSATYLVNNINNTIEEVRQAILDLRETGIDLIRFTFPQVPRGYTQTDDNFIPNRDEVDESMERLKPVIEEMNSDTCQVILMDLDNDYDTYLKKRTLPCFARFVFPSIGFDGYLSHCSESAAPHFRKMVLGNLMERDFWELFYDYPAEDFNNYLKMTDEVMCNLGCKCDRKEHVVNEKILKSGLFPGDT